MNFKRCVVSVAFREPYITHSVRQHANILSQGVNMLSFINRYPFRGGTIHVINNDVTHFQSNLYSFKPHAIKEVIDLGYNSIVWLDPQVLPIDNITLLFDQLEQTEMIVKRGERKLSSVCSDFASQWFRVSKNKMDEDALKDFGGTVYGFNLTTTKTIETFNLWMKSELAGCFGSQDDMMKGHWSDETCMALSVYKTGVKADSLNWKYKNQKEG